MASGATQSADHVRANGRSLRSVSQASEVASRVASGTVNSTSSSVLVISSPTRGRKIICDAVSQPVTAVAQKTKPSGRSAKNAMMTARTNVPRIPGRGWGSGMESGLLSAKDVMDYLNMTRGRRCICDLSL